MTEIKKIIAVTIIWRLLLFLPVIFGLLFIAYRNGYSYTSPLSFFSNMPALLAAFANFDGVHYLSIAVNGYADNGRFFPLFPLGIGALVKIGVTPLLAGLIIAHLFFITALFFFYRLLKLDYPSAKAKEAVWYLLLFPTAFFLVSVYSEGLFLSLTFASFYLARKKNWLGAAVCGALLTMTRLVGLMILPALLWEGLTSMKRNRVRLFPLFFIPVGVIGYSLFSFIKWHDPGYFINAQGQLANGRSVTGIVAPWIVAFRYFRIFFSLPLSRYEWWTAFLEVMITVFAGIYLLRSYQKKVRPAYLIFAIGTFLMPFLSGTLSGMLRYALILFPMYISLSLEKKRGIKLAYILIGIFVASLLLLAFSRGYFVA
ncbi:hypothetical protein HY214_05350 [Candidatus Roizmanbacteria bacterium]|nr:hypothetical protein [Candidatus Roizmanbacteria bacterium]